VEASRRHGSFDTRWPCVGNGTSAAAPLLHPAETAPALDWAAFSDRYFPGRRRHDSEALSAYAAYTQGREWRTGPARLSLVPTESVSTTDEVEAEDAGTRRLLAAMAAAHPRSAKDLR
jgi:hypothetical protein